jgi:hypothetical protein
LVATGKYNLIFGLLQVFERIFVLWRRYFGIIDRKCAKTLVYFYLLCYFCRVEGHDVPLLKRAISHDEGVLFLTDQ